MIRLRATLSGVVLYSLLTTHILTAQGDVVMTTISLPDWVLTAPNAIRFGALVLIKGKTSNRLQVNVLRKELPSRQTPSALSTMRDLPVKKHELRDKPVSRATWIWNTDELLQDSAKQEALISMLTSTPFEKIFLQLPHQFGDDTVVNNKLHSLIAKIHNHGTTVYALAGDPSFSLPEKHALVLDLIQKVIAFNVRDARGERFDGVHLDIEPYLLPGFRGPRKNWILDQYLTVITKGAQATHQGRLLFGTDIPFWYDSPDEFSETIDSIAFDGTRKPTSEHIIDLVDEVCVMSYHTTVAGPNGISSLSEGELAYADSLGKTVFVGLETNDLPDEEHVYFRGVPTSEPSLLGNVDQAVWICQEGDSATVTLLPRAQVDSVVSFTLKNPRGMLSSSLWEVSNESSLLSTNVSFAKLGRSALNKAIDTATRDLSGYKSFGGIAIHDAASYAKLKE